MKKVAIISTIGALALALGTNAANIKDEIKKNPELHEALVTIGVETLEDNGINLELIKMVPKNVLVMGLKAIKDHLMKNNMLPQGSAEMGTQATGNPATMGTQVKPGNPAIRGVQVK